MCLKHQWLLVRDRQWSLICFTELELFSRIAFIFSTQHEAFEFHPSHPSGLLRLYIFYYNAYHPLLFAKVTLHPSPMEGRMVPILEIPEVKPI